VKNTENVRPELVIDQLLYSVIQKQIQSLLNDIIIPSLKHVLRIIYCKSILFNYSWSCKSH